MKWRLGRAYGFSVTIPTTANTANWKKFCIAQGRNPKKVGKCVRIYEANPNGPESVEGMTEEEALDYGNESEDPIDIDPGYVTPEEGETYLLFDGRVLYYGFYEGHRYVWDGKTVSPGLGFNDNSDVAGISPTKIAPPTEEQLFCLPEPFQRPDVDDQGDDQDDQSHGSDCECNTCHNKREAPVTCRTPTTQGSQAQTFMFRPEPEPAKPSMECLLHVDGRYQGCSRRYGRRSPSLG